MHSFARSATFRFAALYSLAFAAVTISLGVAIYQAMRSELRAELDLRIVAARDALLRDGRGALADIVAARERHGAQDMRYAILARGGTTLAGAAIEDVPPAGWSDARFRDEDGSFDDARAIVTPLSGGRRLVVGADPESIERLDQRMVPLMTIAFGLMAVVGIAGGFLMSAALRRRIDAITGTAEAIIRGDMAQRMPVGQAGDEFDRLSATLNRMLDRIDGLMVNLRQVSGDIAHDLRTPLSRLRQKLELASADGIGIDALRGAIDDAAAQADQMLELFTAILSISEVEAGGDALRLKRFDLSALVADIAESYVPSAEDGGREMVRDIAPGLAMDGQRELIAQLLVNLLDNALRHTPSGAEIAVRLTAGRGHATLIVSDDGPGIPAQDRARVFERFTRLDGSRTTPGHGLGLRLVAAIAAAHGATIRLEDNLPGVKMMITFERAA